jgi:hypothetical protein
MKRKFQVNLTIEVEEGGEEITADRLKVFLNGRDYRWNKATINTRVTSIKQTEANPQ